nr:MAG TPA: CRISPR-associated endonuclease [Caudoviricetes sp.]
MTEKEAIIIEEIYLIENSLKEKTLNYFLDKYYNGKALEKLEYLCKRYNIDYILQEESYTSKASFFDNDELPIYNADNPQTYEFSGKRIKRGLYRTKNNYFLNADCNGALNILRKSKAVDLSILCCRGELDTPKRIRIY